MKLSDIVTQANNNLWRNKLRTILTVIAIFVGSFTIILTSAINTGVNSFIDRQVDSAGGEGYIEIAPAALLAQAESIMSGNNSPQEYNPQENDSSLNYITPETLAKIEKIPGIIPGSVRPARSVSVEYITSSNTDKRFKIRVNELPSNSINIDLTAGRSPMVDSDELELTLRPGYPEVLGFDSDEAAIGQQVTLAIKNQATEKLTNVTATIVGVQANSVVSMGRSWINTALNDKIFATMIDTTGIPPQYADQITELASRVMFATAEFDPSYSVDDIKSALEDLKLSGMTINDSIGMMKTFFDAITAVLLVFGAIALLAASIGIINTLFMSVQERTREIGLMKAMGMSSSKVFLSFSVEAIMIGFWGSVFGIIVSIIVGNIGNTLAHEYFLRDLPTFQLVEFTIPNLFLITLLIMFIAFLAGTMPAVRAAKKDPIEALRYE